jgi:DNA-binding transcriptional MerR regulator
LTAGNKEAGALLTIGELSQELGVAQHILRYWETRFPQLKPMQRAGNRRYYRPTDVALVRRINSLLNEQGYTVRGVQKLLRQGGDPAPISAMPSERIDEDSEFLPEDNDEGKAGIDVFRLIAIRNRLSDALES